MVTSWTLVPALLFVVFQVNSVNCGCQGKHVAGHPGDDITFNCELTRPANIECTSNHTLAIPTEFVIKLDEQLEYLCRRSEVRLVCVGDPHNSGGLTTSNWRLSLAAVGGEARYDCKNLDDQLMCLPAITQLTRDASDLTVAVPLADGQLLLFDCAQQSNEDLNCTPSPQNTEKLDCSDFYEIEVSSNEGPKFYVCQSTPCGRLVCSLGESVTIESQDSVNGFVRIEMPTGNGQRMMSFLCKVDGRELLCTADDEPEFTTGRTTTTNMAHRVPTVVAGNQLKLEMDDKPNSSEEFECERKRKMRN